MVKTLSKIIGPYFFAISAAASIISLVFVFVVKEYAVIIALSSFIVFLLALEIRIWCLISHYIKERYPKGHSNNFTFYKYHTVDGVHYKYEVFKDIQCKQPIMTEYRYGFKWSGSFEPKIESRLQKSLPMVKSIAKHEYDHITLCFDPPLLYNQSCVINVIMELNDSDRKAGPYIESKVENPLEVIGFRVELLHKPKKYNGSAKIEKRLINSAMASTYELMDDVPYNTETKSFEYNILKPTIGYYYRISWER